MKQIFLAAALALTVPAAHAAPAMLVPIVDLTSDDSICKIGDTITERIRACKANLAKQTHPDHIAFALTFLGKAYLADRNFAKAIATYDKIFALKPQLEAIGDWKTWPADAAQNRCWARAVWGRQLDRALADCNDAIALSDAAQRYFPLRTRALIYVRMGDYVHAIADCTAFIATSTAYAGIYYMRGVARLKTGDTAAGNQDIDTAKTLDPKIAETYAGYGVAP